MKFLSKYCAIQDFIPENTDTRIASGRSKTLVYYQENIKNKFKYYHFIYKGNYNNSNLKITCISTDK